MRTKLKKIIAVANWSSIISFIVLLAAYSYGFFNEDFSGAAVIGGLFIFIAIEDFLKDICYLDDIKKKVEASAKFINDLADGYKRNMDQLNDIPSLVTCVNEMHDKINKIDTRFDIKHMKECREIDQVIEQTSCELFISSTRMAYWVRYMPDIVKRKDITVRIVVYNSENKGLMQAYKDMMGYKEAYQSSLEDVNKYVKYEHIKIRVIDSIMPTIFFASDIAQANGYIRANHFTANSDTSNIPCVELTSDNRWFENYKKHIEEIWEKARPL